jgi:hypothetical protein
MDAKKLFRFNDLNYYTHIDLARARELKLNIRLITEENKPNFLSYGPETRINYSLMFKQYVTFLSDLKNRDIAKDTVKLILNNAWGCLCEHFRNYHTADQNNKEAALDTEDSLIVENIVPFQKNTINGIKQRQTKSKITYCSKNRYFNTNYGRIQAFLTAKARATISKVMEPNIENIVRCHTDGFICTHPVDNIKLSLKIGDFKLDKQGMCHVKNSNIVEWLKK